MVTPGHCFKNMNLEACLSFVVFVVVVVVVPFQLETMIIVLQFRKFRKGIQRD